MRWLTCAPGSSNSRQQETPKAIAAFDKALLIYQSLGNVEGQASVYYERGKMFLSAGKLADAASQLQRAYDLANAGGNESQKINTLLQLSRLAYSQNAPDKAQAYATEAITFAQSRGLDDLLALGLNELGYAFLSSAAIMRKRRRIIFRRANRRSATSRASLKRRCCKTSLRSTSNNCAPKRGWPTRNRRSLSSSRETIGRTLSSA